jgi:hypothetical protein
MEQAPPRLSASDHVNPIGRVSVKTAPITVPPFAVAVMLWPTLLPAVTLEETALFVT